MIKKTKTKTFDTDTATVVKKVCFGEFGDPAGYETTMYQTPEGDYFLRNPPTRRKRSRLTASPRLLPGSRTTEAL